MGWFNSGRFRRRKKYQPKTEAVAVTDISQVVVTTTEVAAASAAAEKITDDIIESDDGRAFVINEKGVWQRAATDGLPDYTNLDGPAVLKVDDEGQVYWEVTSWAKRVIFDRGYMAGGYRSSSPWKNINKTSHNTDTSVNLGNLMTYGGSYIDGGFSDTTGYTWGIADAYSGSTTTGWGFNLANETSLGSPSAYNMSVARNDHGVSVDEMGQKAYITGGGSANSDKFVFATESMANTGSSGISTDNLGAAWGETQGFHWNGTMRKVDFSSDTWTDGGTGHGSTHSKGLTGKHGYFYMGPQNDTTKLRKYNQNNGTSVGTIGAAYPNHATQGEHNFQTGMTKGYSIGMWNGTSSQVNDSWVLDWGTDTLSYGVGGHAALQPKGQAGCSSGACFSAGAV